MAEEDTVHRPDAYICKACNKRFNEADREQVEQDGIYSMRPVCPHCKSADIVIAWWVEKGEQNSAQ